jgi:hypothetical protein
MGVLIVRLKNVYGNELIYPVNETAETFAALIGKKTFSPDDIKKIQALGFKIEIEQQQIGVK